MINVIGLYLRACIAETEPVNLLFDTILSFRIPVMAFAFIVPLFVGAISGTPSMGIAICFPILLPMCDNPSIHIVCIIFVGLISSYIMSPLHLCLIVSNTYFKSDLNKVYKYLLPRCGALYVLDIAYHLILEFL